MNRSEVGLAGLASERTLKGRMAHGRDRQILFHGLREPQAHRAQSSFLLQSGPMNPARRPLIAANWKMNPSPVPSLPTGQAGPQSPVPSRQSPVASRQPPAASPYSPRSDIDVITFPTFLDIPMSLDAGLIVGGQWGHPQEKGAFTGDVSMNMLKNLGCRYVLCGHSERRRFHHETDAFVLEQACRALEIGLHPIVCIGESGPEREHGKQKEAIERQIKNLPQSPLLIIAYEPVWAIGTGKTATPAEAQEMHAFIRSLLSKDTREQTRILYGGSANAANAKELLSQPDIDGLLVGNASLKPEEFGKIIEAAAS